MSGKSFGPYVIPYPFGQSDYSMPASAAEAADLVRGYYFPTASEEKLGLHARAWDRAKADCLLILRVTRQQCELAAEVDRAKWVGERVMAIEALTNPFKSRSVA